MQVGTTLAVVRGIVLPVLKEYFQYYFGLHRKTLGVEWIQQAKYGPLEMS